MGRTDVAIVGGGLAGSTAAAMLGRAGIDAVLIDPHRNYPEDFRCEKFDASQVEVLRKTGLADAVLPTTTPVEELWVGARGRILDRRPGDQFGFAYDALVKAIRAQIPSGVPFLPAKATKIATGAERQTVSLSTGEEISARLVVLANGLNSGLRHALGMTREDLSPCHSISIGFDLVPVGRHKFEFGALTCYPRHAADRFAYLTLFPIGTTMRANFFVYRDMRDPWLSEMRNRPRETLLAAIPGLDRLIGAFEVPGFVKIRPVDLYATEGYRQAGLVLVGDAFATSCPAAGTGANKALTDVERLCNVHVPDWLASPGMGADKIAAYYDDPVKIDCDAHSLAKAWRLRAMSTGTGLGWRARRLARVGRQFALGAVRAARQRLATAPVGERVHAGGGP